MNEIWIIMIAVMVASFIIQQVLNHKFDEFSRVGTPGGLTGADVARKMLEDNGITDVQVLHVDGRLTDHYNPADKTLNLSDAVYGSASIAAAAVAAHECGHALQHAYGYGPLKLRSSLVPAVTFANSWVQWILLAGVIFVQSFPMLLWFGIALFAMTTIFSFVTLPVEVNASRRAIAWLESSGITNAQTSQMASTALKWAAYTYVVAALGSLATLFYYIAIARNRR